MAIASRLRVWGFAAVLLALAPLQAASAIEGVGIRLNGLDKITGKVKVQELAIGTAWQFGRLRAVVMFCDRTPPTEVPESSAYVHILEYVPTGKLGNEQGIAEEDLPAAQGFDAQSDPVSLAFLEELGSGAYIERFQGWMLASSPALNPLDHPLYDVWVLECIVPK